MLAGIGVCDIEDIALTVLTTVNGWNEKDQCLLVDAGWMAISSDLGTELQDQNQYYGLVSDEQGQIMYDLVVKVVNQEHGIISVRPGSSGKTPRLPIGTRLRILPIHACATAAQHNGYHVLDENDVVTDFWPRFGGW